MIDLVLQYAREQPLGLDQLLLAVEIDIAHPHLRRPLDLFGDFGNRKTAFLVHDRFVRRPDQFRVDQRDRMLGLLAARRVDGDHALCDADLHRGEPDARRVVHGLEHVLRERPHLLVDARDRRRFLPQQRIGQAG